MNHSLIITKKHWSEAERHYAWRNRGRLSAEQIGQKLGRSRSSVCGMWDRQKHLVSKLCENVDISQAAIKQEFQKIKAAGCE